MSNTHKESHLVYVVNKKGKPLMPTIRFDKVKKLLKSGKAVPICNNPFTIRLKYKKERLDFDFQPLLFYNLLMIL